MQQPTDFDLKQREKLANALNEIKDILTREDIAGFITVCLPSDIAEAVNAMSYDHYDATWTLLRLADDRKKFNIEGLTSDNYANYNQFVKQTAAVLTTGVQMSQMRLHSAGTLLHSLLEREEKASNPDNL